MNDPFNLERFVDAQNFVYERVQAELQRGRKLTHWMWFIFPQIKGLGRSDLAIKFGISGRIEAAAYLNHVVLGPRLQDCTRLVLNAAPRCIEDIFGSPDDLKFRSSMTLFDFVMPRAIFNEALETFFRGRGDPMTRTVLQQ